MFIENKQKNNTRLTHFMPLDSFYTPWKPEVFWCSRAVLKETSGMKWINKKNKFENNNKIRRLLIAGLHHSKLIYADQLFMTTAKSLNY